MPKRINKIQGFTIIELMIVIVMIASIALLFINTFPGAMKSARDTQRRSDLKQYQTAIERFANSKDSFYPALTNDTGTRASTTLCGLIGLSSGDCPEDPRYITNPSTWTFYKYESDGTVGLVNATNYVLWARLEREVGQFFVVCSDGSSGYAAAEPSTTNGICPAL